VEGEEGEEGEEVGDAVVTVVVVAEVDTRDETDGVIDLSFSSFPYEIGLFCAIILFIIALSSVGSLLAS
jgi:hypothetical protein